MAITTSGPDQIRNTATSGLLCWHRRHSTPQAPPAERAAICSRLTRRTGGSPNGATLLQTSSATPREPWHHGRPTAHARQYHGRPSAAVIAASMMRARRLPRLTKPSLGGSHNARSNVLLAAATARAEAIWEPHLAALRWWGRRRHIGRTQGTEPDRNSASPTQSSATPRKTGKPSGKKR